MCLQCLPALGCLAGAFGISDSPLYLAKVGQKEKAIQTLEYLHKSNRLDQLITEEIERIDHLLSAEERETASSNLLSAMLLEPSNRRRLIVGLCLIIFQELSGTCSIESYTPQALQQMGEKSLKGSLLATGIYGIIKVVLGVLFFTILAETVGRRKSLLWSGLGMACTMYFLGTCVKVFTIFEDGKNKMTQISVCMMCLYLFAA